jgi:hypothetical protein
MHHPPPGFFWSLGSIDGSAAVIQARYTISVHVIVTTGWQLVIAGVPISIAALALGFLREPFLPSLAIYADHRIHHDRTGWPWVTWLGSIVGMMPKDRSSFLLSCSWSRCYGHGAVIHGEPPGPLFEISAMMC